MSAQQALVRVTGKPSSGFPGKGAGALACCSCRRRCCCPCSRCSSCCSTGLEGADQVQRVDCGPSNRAGNRMHAAGRCEERPAAWYLTCLVPAAASHHGLPWSRPQGPAAERSAGGRWWRAQAAARNQTRPSPRVAWLTPLPALLQSAPM